jgi:hypothetical protein
LKTNNLKIDFEEPGYGLSLLNWCILNDKRVSFEQLLKLGGNANWGADNNGNFSPAVIEASRVINTSFYLKLCLQYGGNVNLISRESEGTDRISPLFGAIYSRRLESVKLLIDSGADVNLTRDSMWTPLAEALIQDDLEIAKQLLDRGANYRDIKVWTQTVALDSARRPIHDKFNSLVMRRDSSRNILDLLRGIQLPLDSRGYEIKMDIVRFLKGKGLDYWSYPIPETIKIQHKMDAGYLAKY